MLAAALLPSQNRLTDPHVVDRLPPPPTCAPHRQPTLRQKSENETHSELPIGSYLYASTTATLPTLPSIQHPILPGAIVCPTPFELQTNKPTRVPTNANEMVAPTSSVWYADLPFQSMMDQDEDVSEGIGRRGWVLEKAKSHEGVTGGWTEGFVYCAKTVL